MTTRQGRIRAGLLLIGAGACAAVVGLLLPRTPAIPPSSKVIGWTYVTTKSFVVSPGQLDGQGFAQYGTTDGTGTPKPAPSATGSTGSTALGSAHVMPSASPSYSTTVIRYPHYAAPRGAQLSPTGQASELLGGGLVLAGGATLLSARRRP